MSKAEITVRAQQRTDHGKNDARRARRKGLVPLTVYGGGEAAVSAVAPLAELAAILRSDSGYNTIFRLDVDGLGASEVMFHDRQLDPVLGRLVHADLRRLVSGEKIEMNLPIHLVGVPIGVKEFGGYMDQVIHSLSVLCDPHTAPEAINVDVSGLNVNQSMHVSDIAVPEGIQLLDGPDILVVAVGMIKEAAPEPVVEATVEPEVINKGKKDENAP